MRPFERPGGTVALQMPTIPGEARGGFSSVFAALHFGPLFMNLHHVVMNFQPSANFGHHQMHW